jgi:HD-GYP domain-containing protein (c-di-GMP phosphodiesterase class II)
LQAEVGGVRHHHERWDGAGYPDGLSGEAIPLEARIIAVADVFDALTSPRPYRGAWTRSRALAQIRQQSGLHFDPRCVEALERVIEYQEGPRPVVDAPEDHWALAAS